MAATIIEIQARGFDDVGTRVDSLKHRLDSVKTSAQKASTDGIEKLTANGGAMGILNDLTGGLAMQFKDAYESIQLTNTGLKGMKAALLATGIGAIVVAIGLIAANWDDIVKSMTAASKEAELQASIAKDLYDMNIEQLEIIEASEASLRLQGKTEAEILALKKAETEEAILSLEAHIAAQKLIKDQQVKTAERNQEILKGLLKFITFPIQLILDQVDKLGAIIGKEWDFQNQFNEVISNLVFDPKKVAQEGEDTIKEMEKTLVGLKGKRDSYELSIQAIDKAAQDKRAADALAEAKRLEDIEKKAEADRLARKQAANEASLNEEKARIAREQRERQTELEIMFLEEEALTRKEEQEAEKRKQNEEKLSTAKRNLTTSTFAFLQTIAELYGKGNEKRARDAFRISKALSLAEATANTYLAITAVLTDKTLPGPTKFIAAASAGLIGLGNIAKIAATQFNPGSSGGGGGGAGSMPSFGGGGSPQGQAPQAALDFSFLQNQQPIQTYVIGSDVKTANEAQQKIKDQSTL
jgi:hypothetical protein